MNKKGFTLIELLGVVAILAILLGIAVVAVNKTIKRSRDKTFNVLVSSLEDGTLQAYTECVINGGRSFCENHRLSSITSSNTTKIKLRELVDGGYVDNFQNPYQSGTSCDLDASYVEISLGTIKTTEDSTIDTNTKLYDYLLGVNEYYKYKSCLVCGDKRSEGCN